MRKILNFLDLPIAEEILDCAVNRNSAMLKRNHSEKQDDHFTEAMKKAIRHSQKYVFKILKGRADIKPRTRGLS